ncbi:HalOD1 output domain-containing protein [Halorarius litoreus]|uniref:HalOD1 output domain-containing protein n=1 Tax=Halorarius litoreus TaxID=2962676 RepID=UPI0020CBF100|nr:HalOD1 output domain-containing protein [Halorarius litoreus]
MDTARGTPRQATTEPAEYRAYHDPSRVAKLSTTVVHALADAMDVDVTDAGFVLYDIVDPDSLDRLFARTTDPQSGAPSHVAFTVDGYRVTVYSTGQIVITPPDTAARDRPY